MCKLATGRANPCCLALLPTSPTVVSVLEVVMLADDMLAAGANVENSEINTGERKYSDRDA
jgi:hypothetical protein